jgi:hypothetical protein
MKKKRFSVEQMIGVLKQAQDIAVPSGRREPCAALNQIVSTRSASSVLPLFWNADWKVAWSSLVAQYSYSVRVGSGDRSLISSSLMPEPEGCR